MTTPPILFNDIKETVQLEIDAMSENKTQADNLLDIMSRMQSELSELENENADLNVQLVKVTAQLNSIRLMMFPRADGSDYITNCQKIQVSIVDMIAEDPTLDKLSQFHKQMLFYTSLASETIDKHKSDKIVKIARKEKHEKAMQEVEAVRREPKTKTAKLKLTQLDKALMGIRKTYHMLDDASFIKMVKVTDAYSQIPDADIQTSINKTKGH